MYRERLRELLAILDSATDVSAVLTIHIHRFNALDESVGHPFGDALLRMVADRVASALRRGEIATRIDGEDFGVVQTGQDQPRAAAGLAKRLIELLGRTYVIDGYVIKINASVGVALAGPGNRDTELMLKNAVQALYHAKKAGGGVVRFFEATMDEQIQARRNLEIDLRRAAARREFAMVYQPQISLASGDITGFEALLRWRSPQRGLVPPSGFISVIEDLGLIVPIGEWALLTACREAASWKSGLTVAVNVSAVQFNQPGLVSAVRAALSESGLPPDRLELEITESVLLTDHGAARDTLNRIRDMGARISMDDFGTGYSSLSLLQSFPFDRIKIDQSFVRAGPDDPSGPAIIRAIAALGASLGMATTAEGVETEAQLERVSADGCTDVQGYLIGRPIWPEQIDPFMRARRSADAFAVSA